MSASDKTQAQAGAATTTQEAGLLDVMLNQFTPNTAAERRLDVIDTLVKEAMSGQITIEKNLTKTIKGHIKKLDERISKQLSAVMHNEQFQKLEGSWRGLKHLVFNSKTGTDLKIKVLNVPRKDLFNDLDNAIEFDQSETFKKIYSSEFDMPGGQPYACLIGDYEFTNHPEDVELLAKMSNVAAAGFCPFISAANPELFGFNSWTDLMKPRDLAKIFDTVEYTKWTSFRKSEDSRFVTLVMPRVLARLPYGKNTRTVEAFDFQEATLDANGKDVSMPHDHYTWMNAAYVMGTRLTAAFKRSGFCTAIRGAENGGKIEGLPAHIFKSDDGDSDLKCPTEIGITDRRENELSNLGFLPLCHYKNTDYAVFFGAQTAQKPKVYNKAEATANAAISARLPYIMATARFAHYLKVIARDMIGSFQEKDDLSRFLNGWIREYVTSSAEGAELRARFPLRDARVDVYEIPSKPGAYDAKIYMRPWLQLEELTASLMMVTKLPAPQA